MVNLLAKKEPVIHAPNIGVVQLSKVSTNGKRLVGSAVESQHIVNLRVSQGSATSDEFTKEIIRATDTIVEIQMTSLQWGELVSSFGVGQGVPVTINQLGNDLVDQVYVTKELDAFYEERTKKMINESLTDINAAMDTAYDILKNKKTITKSDRDSISKAYMKTQSLLADALPFITKLLVEDTETYIAQATAQFKTDMAVLLNEQTTDIAKQLEQKNKQIE